MARRAPRSLVAMALAIAVLFAAPTAYVVLQALALGSDLGSLLTDERTVDALRRTLTLGLSVAVAASIVGTGLAWLVTRTDLPLRRLWAVLAPLPMVFPSFVGAAALLAAVAPGGLVSEVLGTRDLPEVRGFWGAWFVLTLFTFPYVYLPVAARMASLPPSLEESARLLGRRPWGIFRSVVLPQARPAIAAGALLVFLYTISDFGAVELLRYGTLTRGIYANRDNDPSTAFAFSLLLVSVALVIVLAERMMARRHVVTEASRSRRPLQVPLRRWRWPALAAVVAVIGNALLGPVLVLGYWVVRGLTVSAAGTLDGDDLSGLWQPALNTAGIGLLTAACAVLLVLPVAYLTARFRNRSGDAANVILVGGFALPGIVIAFAMVRWVLAADLLSPLYGTYTLLVLAYAVHFGAQAMRASQVAVAGVPVRLDDAARMLGARRVRRLATVELPLMLPGLIAGGGLVLLSTMKELPITLLLAPFGFETLATRIWTSATGEFQARTGLYSLALVALSAVLTWVFVVRRADRFD